MAAHEKQEVLQDLPRREFGAKTWIRTKNARVQAESFAVKLPQLLKIGASCRGRTYATSLPRTDASTTPTKRGARCWNQTNIASLRNLRPIIRRI